jgi:thioredoxin reductase (NADPH)
VESAAPGGQVLSTAEIENYPGFPKGVKGWELADLFDAHLAEYPVARVRGDVASVESVEGGLYRIALAEGEALEAKAIVVCTGAKHRDLGAPGEDSFRGRGVSYCAVCDGNFYRGRDVVVVGGGNSALEEALYLSRIVNKVYLVHRRDSFRGAQIYVDKIRATENIELVTSSVIDEIRGSNAGMDSVAVRDLTSGETRIIPAEGLFVYVGMAPVSGFLPSQVARDAAGFIQTDAEMCTSVPGVFAAGDVRAKRCRQVSTAVGDGATAATAALSYLEHWNA